ncbi:hypothetical protein ACWCOV_08675 [Kribbella sp. NPDC002412]
MQGVSGSACSTGASLYAGTYSYMSSMWHCHMEYGNGTWVGYDSSKTIGIVKVSAGHLNESRDFMIITTPSNAGRIWFGDWKTTTSIPVRGMERPYAGTGPVTYSCGASGSGHYQYVLLDNEQWRVRGRVVGPGFYTEQYPQNPPIGYVQPGDSGSPIVRGGSSYYLVQGFLSAGGLGNSPYCAPGRHPGFDGDPIDGCYTEYWAVYADAAISSFGGLRLKTDAP